jgi:tetratricopeptide (TPR) repeat protein
VPKLTVFLSYSHRDERWKDLLRPHLKMLEQLGTLEIWDDRRIDAGENWYPEIKQAMEGAAAAVCLISVDYLASDFCAKEEIPYLLERRKKNGMFLLPVLVRPCAWKVVPWLREIQMLPRDGKTVEQHFADSVDEVFSQVAERLFERLDAARPREATRGYAVEERAFGVERSVQPEIQKPEKEDLTRLPITGAELFGRQQEIEWLDAAWSEDRTRIAALVAWGGVGKSTLVNKWLERMSADGFRGARRVFGWSFFSQGTNERSTSADLFIETALTFFGDPEPSQGSPWAKGERLAELVRQERSLLVLDGLEPLQSSMEGGRIKDPALAMLLAGLARPGGAGGLCVITTREKIADLEPFPETVEEKNLEQISPEAGRALLRVRGVRGTDAELEEVARAFGGHALAIDLLASYLREVPGHPATAALARPDLDLVDDQGRHPRRVMEAFVSRFGEGPEIELLSLLGLFDRPTSDGAMSALREKPQIPGLTRHLVVLSKAKWLLLVEKLREARLLAPKDKHDPDSLDAHPLIREHFGQRLEANAPSAWREANGRLFEHYRDLAEPLPDTLEGLAPLFAAVAHGCAASRFQEALDEIYWKRIQRREEVFASRRIGAYGAQLAALRGFFASGWQLGATGLSDRYKSYLLNEAAYCLRALGKLAEAVEPFKAALALDLEKSDWMNASTDIENLTDLSRARVNLEEALELARQGVELSDRSGVGFRRMVARSELADVLHQSGEAEEAKTLFIEAEAMLRELKWETPFLYSRAGYYYCDLLLARGEWQEVERRVEQTIAIGTSKGWLDDIALDHLSWGRAALLEAEQRGSRDFREAAEHLERGVQGLRQAGQLMLMPSGLLARAELWRAQGDLTRSRLDLDEALTLAARCGMRLHEADAHLGFVRLHLAEGKKEEARASLERARMLVAEIGYHRRDPELAELTAALG